MIRDSGHRDLKVEDLVMIWFKSNLQAKQRQIQTVHDFRILGKAWTETVTWNNIFLGHVPVRYGVPVPILYGYMGAYTSREIYTMN